MQRLRAKKNFIITGTGVAILLVCGIAAQRACAIPPSAADQTGNAERGRKLFLQNCAKCHGANGSGDTPIGKAIRAKDLRAAEAQKMSDAQIFNQIAVGSGNMPSLSNAIEEGKADELRAQANDLVAYIRELGSATRSSGADETGNAERGRKLFLQNCAKCHGANGSGDTPIGKAVKAKDLRAAEAQKMSDAQIFNQIAMGSGNMPSLSNAIEEGKADELRAQANDLVAYIRELGKQNTGAKKP
jgi:ubiquinol-cytochrome c reductase cytochrome c subunit